VVLAELGRIRWTWQNIAECGRLPWRTVDCRRERQITIDCRQIIISWSVSNAKSVEQVDVYKVTEVSRDTYNNIPTYKRAPLRSN